MLFGGAEDARARHKTLLEGEDLQEASQGRTGLVQQQFLPLLNLSVAIAVKSTAITSRAQLVLREALVIRVATS
jgi:hypothetical protein